jgi:adenosylhomocysteinase
MTALDPLTARDIVNALRSGTVPQAGLHHLAVGVETEETACLEQLDHVATGRGAYKFVRGAYGAGKTFLARLILEDALARNFVVGEAVISPDTPLHKLEQVYARLVSNLRTPGQEHALKALLDRWIYRVEDRLIELEGLSEDDPRLLERTEQALEADLARIAALDTGFSLAVRGYYRAQAEGDFAIAQSLIGWLSGQGTVGAAARRYAGIRGQVDSSMALTYLQAVCQAARMAGHTGLVILLDEVETVQRLRGPEREKSLSNVRQIVDAVHDGDFRFTYFLFTGTPSFFEDRKGVPSLQPLHERIKLMDTDDRFRNLRQPQIVLRAFDRERLLMVARKVREIYEVAYQPVDHTRVSDAFIEGMADHLTHKFDGRVDVLPRIFLREFVHVLDLVQDYPGYDPAARYVFDLDKARGEGLLTAEEDEVSAIVF